MKRSVQMTHTRNGDGTNNSKTEPDSVMNSYKPITTNKSPALYNGTESHQYEPDESEVWWHHQLQRYCSLNTHNYD